MELACLQTLVRSEHICFYGGKKNLIKTDMDIFQENLKSSLVQTVYSINGHPFEDPDWADYTQIVYLYLAQMEGMAVDNDVKNYCSSNKSSSGQHIIVVTVTQCMCNCTNIQYLYVMW